MNPNAGIHFNHIKTFIYIDGVADQLDTDEIRWMAEHYDLAVGQIGAIDLWRTYSPQTRICAGRALEYLWQNHDGPRLSAWAAAHGMDGEAAYHHYREDAFVPMVNRTVPGWNPDDDQGQCGGVAGDWVNDLVSNVNGNCTGLPSDPLRSAANGSAARVPNNPTGTWFVPDVTSAVWMEWATADVIEWEGWVLPVPPGFGNPDCIWEDNAVYWPSGLQKFDKTFRYWDVPEGNPDGSRNLNHPQIADRANAGRELARRVSQALGRDVLAWPNLGSLWPHTSEPYKSIMMNAFDHSLVEWWLDNTGVIQGPSYANSYPQILSTLELTRVFHEYKYLKVTTYLPFASGTFKMLALATFYLVNNERTSFQFQINASPDYPNRPTDHPRAFNWIEAMAHDIGQPVPNVLGIPDFESVPGTEQHFEFASGPDPSNPGDTFHVLGREYEHALVLVKLQPQRTSDRTAASETVHALNRTYRPLQVDGSLAAPLSSITLRNNEGAILIKEP